ncbi:MAG: rhomboid family intramembrane serine protease [Syntrophorhabdus aromaticivorans]|uniref:Rhomboid family intramembrane serine protease n=1 Tax=Syntrophorhabdus aromaticivorans TaxID=328301 RepID=A0A971S1C8_9BACT|nr:rhomboid family intramembrane serine protease [Syntrophorhabdus aromaticivorans]
MIPLRDNIAARTPPIITACIVFVNILIFGWMSFALTGPEGQAVYRYYGLVPRELSVSLSTRWDLAPYNVLTVFSSMFLHGGVIHLVGNMLYLWIFGNNVEDAMGHKRFIVFYLLSGIIAALFQFLYDPFSNIPMIGASGAVSGILGAYLVLFPYARIKTLLFIVIFIKIVEIPAIVLLTIWFFMQILYLGHGGVAWYAHIGGFVFGLVTVKLFSRKSAGKARG